VQVLAAGTKIEQDGEQGKPMSVNVVTLLVTPEESEKLTLGAT
jgi:Flp pilus assembly protein CpaB